MTVLMGMILTPSESSRPVVMPTETRLCSASSRVSDIVF